MLIKKYKLVLNERRQPELLKERSFQYNAEKQVNSPSKVAELLRGIGLADSFEELLYLLTFDSKLRLTGVFEVSHGTTTASMTDPASIFRRAMLVGAHGIVLAHNHPSGDISPSQDDIETTEHIKKCGEVLSCQLIDHIIIGNGYYSMKEEGVI